MKEDKALKSLKDIVNDAQVEDKNDLMEALFRELELKDDYQKGVFLTNTLICSKELERVIKTNSYRPSENIVACLINVDAMLAHLKKNNISVVKLTLLRELVTGILHDIFREKCIKILEGKDLKSLANERKIIVPDGFVN